MIPEPTVITVVTPSIPKSTASTETTNRFQTRSDVIAILRPRRSGTANTSEAAVRGRRGAGLGGGLATTRSGGWRLCTRLAAPQTAPALRNRHDPHSDDPQVSQVDPTSTPQWAAQRHQGAE